MLGRCWVSVGQMLARYQVAVVQMLGICWVDAG